MKTLLKTLLIAIVIFSSCTVEKYKDKSLGAEERAKDLVDRLTLEEKVSLMMNASEAVPRLGIKKYDWWNEALHGVARNGTATAFPQAIGMAASFDDKLLYEVFTTVSDEARVKHRIAREMGDMARYTGLTMWTPNINIFRDPRWGRGQETYGEDPYLTSVLGVSVIKGLQGEVTDETYKLFACAKHYAVHSGPEWNRHSFDAKNIAPRDLWETYLPAFEAAVKKGNVQQVMCAYNRFEGEPCCGSKQLLIEILRDKWNYDGIILSDCWGIDNFFKEGRHETHPDTEHAVASAVLSGTDLECGESYQSLIESVKQGLIDETEVDVSMRRIMKARFELGEMDGTSPWDDLPDSLVNCRENSDLAHKMAQESMVLLKNNGILPMKQVKNLVVIGPNADNIDMQMANYYGYPKHTVTLLEAIRKQLPDADIKYEKFCDHTAITESVFDECEYDGKKGFGATFWNNLEMEGEVAGSRQFENTFKIGRMDTFCVGVEPAGVSAILKTKFTPKKSGPVNFIFATSNTVSFSIDGKKYTADSKPENIKALEQYVVAGKTYDIEVEWIRSGRVEFRFDISRKLELDLNNLKTLVKDADAVIFAGGITAELESEESAIAASGFKGGDRTNIELPQIQRDIISAIKKMGKKVILVNFSGSAMALTPESKNCDAILQAWYPGERGGDAIVDVLTGKYNPAGRLPVTFYKSTNQLPDFEDYSMKNRTYRYMKEEPLYPFGYGLSYTTFSYGEISIDKKEIGTGETVKLTIPISNTGNMDGEEVTQVYLRKKDDAEGPDKALRAFKRIAISSGETKNLEFELTSENLNWWNPENETMEMFAGKYELLVGGNSKNEDLKTIELSIK